MTDTVGKPFPGFDFDDFDGCVAAVSDDDSIDDPEAFCAWLEAEGKDALSDPQADEVLTDLSVEFVSAVDEPAQDSEWVLAKNAEGPTGTSHRWGTSSPILLKAAAQDGVEPDVDDGGDEKQIAYAPVLIPGEADKQGDVIPDHEIESAAHDYLANHRKVDADHDLLDGKGVPVESWVAKNPTTFDLPDGDTSREYPAGTWFLGIQFDDDTWSRVKNGELSGLSIYGGAKPLDVDDVRASLADAPDTNATKNTDMNFISKADSDDFGGFQAVVNAFADDHGVDPAEATVAEVKQWFEEERDDEDSVKADDADEDDVIDALKAVAAAVDDLDDRVAAIESETDVADFANGRMGDDAGNERATSLKSLIDDDDGGEPRRKAVAGQFDGGSDDGDVRVNYEGITEDEDADATAGGIRTKTANKRMTDLNGGD